MELKTVNISRASYGDMKGRFVASCCLKGDGNAYTPEIQIAIPDELLQPIVGIIMQAVSHSMSKAAADFEADVKASLEAPIEHEAIAPPETNYDVPF